MKGFTRFLTEACNWGIKSVKVFASDFNIRTFNWTTCLQSNCQFLNTLVTQ